MELLNDYDCISLNGEIDTEYKDRKKRNKCPKCGYEEPKVRGIPCRTKKCPKCDTPLHGRGNCLM